MLNKKNIEEIKRIFLSLASTSFTEENIKIKVVVEFLKMLEYDIEDFDFEHSVYHNEKRIDFVIFTENKNFLYVETKRGDRDLNQSDIIQLANYLNIRSIEWGLLTNGKQYILVNNKIETTIIESASLEDKIVFRLDLFSNKDYEFFNYLSKKSLFESLVTNYFRDIAQFRAYKFPLGKSSWKVYKSTLVSFF